MTPELQRLFVATTCGQCHGNGRLGGRSLKKLPDGTHYHQDEGYTCPTCKGRGIQPMTDDA